MTVTITDQDGVRPTPMPFRCRSCGAPGVSCFLVSRSHVLAETHQCAHNHVLWL